MIVINNILVSDDVIEEQFMCNLDACKGACCVEGDWGAPLEQEEMELLDSLLEKIKPFLSEESKAILSEKGSYTWVPELKKYGTSLHKSGACVFLVYNDMGIAMCGIEQAHNEGVIEFRKPISCHLYPIRISKNEETGFEAMNYDRWEICNPACLKGKQLKMPLFQFSKDAIIRAYGQSFYDELEAATKYLEE